MKSLLFPFLILFNFCLVAQTIYPYKFFPSAVGNVWEYSNGQRIEILRDSTSQDSSLYLWVPNYDVPLYKIDNKFTVFYDPIGGIVGPPLNWIYFKLNADSGDTWIVETHHIVDTFYVYKLAEVISISEGYFYDHFTTFKEITFYKDQSDSVVNEFSWPDFTITLAYGIGEVLNVNEESGVPPVSLLGCIIDGDTIGVITSAEDEQIIVNSFQLFQNYPNPFNPTTTIKYSISEPQQVKLIVYSLLGEKIKVLVDDYKTSGSYTVNLNAGGLSSGVYIYKIQVNEFSSTKKMLFLK